MDNNNPTLSASKDQKILRLLSMIENDIPDFDIKNESLELSSDEEVEMTQDNQYFNMIDKFQKSIKWYPTRQDLEGHMRELIESGLSTEPKAVDHEKIEYDISEYIRRRPSDCSEYTQQTIKRKILDAMLLDARRLQIASLNEWEKEMNVISKGKPLIHVENMVDLESAPVGFFYVNENFPGKGVVIPDDPPIGCECSDCTATGSADSCCYSHHSQKMTYTFDHKVRVPPGTPIYECNKRCKCSADCPNRVVQRGACVKLCVFRTSNGTGWGVKTLHKIRRGSFVIENVGEVITKKEAEVRGKRYGAAKDTYLFHLDFHETIGQCPFTVDCAVYGNISRFINHSSKPNLAVYCVWINCLDPNLPKLAFFATRDIKGGEELTIDYVYANEDRADGILCVASSSSKSNF